MTATLDTRRTMGGRINASRPVAERITEGHESVVILDLAPIATSLVRDIAQALARADHLVPLITVGRGRAGDAGQTEAMESLVRTLVDAGALQVELGDSQASELSEELEASAVEPELCEIGSCDLLAAPGWSYCRWHLDVTL